MKRGKSGFTLVELLIVVGVIALVLAIAMPRERAFDPNMFAGELTTLLNLSAQAARSSNGPVSVRHGNGQITAHGSSDLAPLLESRVRVPDNATLPQGEIVRFAASGRATPAELPMQVGRQSYTLAISGLGGVQIR